MSMNRKNVLLSVGLSATVAGCSAFAPRAELSIRPVDDAQLAVTTGEALPKGREQLALGQNGLAISSFRTALRDDPESAEALNGLAIAYDRIGRPDLARRYFELAIAKAPEEPKYNGNLARLLERDDGAKLARTSAPAALPSVADAGAAVEGATPRNPGLADKPMILAALGATDAVASVAMADPLQNLTQAAPVADFVPDDVQSVEATANEDRPAVLSRPALFRPAAPVAVRAASIEPRNLPTRPVAPLPGEKQPMMPFDAPRSPGAPEPREGARLERVSLGEVRLITTPTRPVAAQASLDNFDSFGVRLASWLPAAITREHVGPAPAVKQKPALRQALSRAALELAVAETEAAAPASAEKSGFTYAFFDEERIFATTLAAL